MNNYVDVNLVTLKKIDKRVAKQLIENHHYSRTFSHCTYALGIYYKETHPLFDDKYDKLIGCLTYGHPIGRSVISSIAVGVKLDYENVLELTRLWIEDGYGKNIESYSIGQSFKWLKQNAPEIEVLVSYSDPEYGHVGTIYQSTNWLYQGNNFSGKDGLHPESYVSFTKDPYKWIHPRTLSTLHGSSSNSNLVNLFPTPFWRKRIVNKHRYLYFLCGKRRKKEILNALKYPILPYPPHQSIQPEIFRIDMENGQLIVTLES